jgi:hypothetical protein
VAVVLPVALFGVAATSAGDDGSGNDPYAHTVTVGRDGALYIGADGFQPL